MVQLKKNQTNQYLISLFITKLNQDKCRLHSAPREKMWADVLTKPLKGSKLRQIRGILINCPLSYGEKNHVSTLSTQTISNLLRPTLPSVSLASTQGCVGESAVSCKPSVIHYFRTIKYKSTKSVNLGDTVYFQCMSPRNDVSTWWSPLTIRKCIWWQPRIALSIERQK